MRTNLVILLLCLAFIGNLFATSVYENETASHTIPPIEQFVKGYSPGNRNITIQVLDNTDYCAFTCHLIFNATSDILLLAEDINTTFENEAGEDLSHLYSFSYKVPYANPVHCINTTGYTAPNGTIVNNTPYICDWEIKYKWIDGLPNLLPGQTATVKLTGHKQPWENIDAIPIVYGVEFKEFAWWNDTGTLSYWAEPNEGILLNLSLVTDHTFQIIINSSQATDTGNISNVTITGDDFNGASIDTSIWDTGGTPTVSDGWMNLDASGDLIYSKTAVNATYADTGYSAVMYCNVTDTKGSFFGFTESDTPTTGFGFAVQRGTSTKEFITHSDAHASTKTNIVWNTSNVRYEFAWYNSTNVSFYMNNILIASHSTNIATDNHDIIMRNWQAGTVINCDYAYIKKTSNTANVSVNCANISATLHNCTIVTDTNLTDYQVLIPYSEVGDIGSNLSITIYSGSNVTPPTPFSVTNYTYTTPQYETAEYNYTINYTLGGIYDSSNETILEYNNTHNFTATCTNMSVNYSCYYNSLPAKLVETNGTTIPLKWIIEVQNITGNTTKTQSFNTNVLYGVWPTAINAPASVLEEDIFYINTSYSTVINANLTLNATITYNSSSGFSVCSGGTCNTSITAPQATTTAIHQSEGVLGVYSPYWLSEVNRTIEINITEYLTASTVFMSESGVGSPNNANDSDWVTNATFASGNYLIFTYELTYLNNIDQWKVKDNAGAEVIRNLTIPEDCFDTNISLKITRNPGDDDGLYMCRNYTDGSYAQFYDTNGTFARFYEQNVTYSRTNSLTRLYPTGLTDCSIGVHLFNYSCRDEDTQNLMNCNYSQTFTVVSATGTEYDTFSGDAQTWEICYYPATFQANISSIEQYEATNYNTRFYYLFDVATGNTSYNQSIFLADDTDSIITFIYVKDAGVNVVGAYIYIQKYFVEEGVFKTVAWARSDTEGKGVTYLVPNDEFYRFVVLQAGEITFTSETMQIGCAGSYCSVTLNIESTYSEFWEMYNTIGSSCSFNNDTKVIACTFAVTDGTQHTFTLDVYEWERGEPILNCTNSTTTASGTLFCDIGDNSTTGMFTYSLSAHSLPNFLQQGEVNLNALADWGDDGIIIALFIIIVLAGAFALMGPEFMALGAYIGIIMSSALELLHLNLIALVGLGVIVGVFIYAFRR